MSRQNSEVSTFPSKAKVQPFKIVSVSHMVKIGSDTRNERKEQWEGTLEHINVLFDSELCCLNNYHNHDKFYMFSNKPFPPPNSTAN